MIDMFLRFLLTKSTDGITTVDTAIHDINDISTPVELYLSRL